MRSNNETPGFQENRVSRNTPNRSTCFWVRDYATLPVIRTLPDPTPQIIYLIVVLKVLKWLEIININGCTC